MSQSSTRRLPPELERYTLFSRWDREDAEARRRQRALEELAQALKRRQADRCESRP